MQKTLYKALAKQGDKYYISTEMVETQEQAEALFQGSNPDFVTIIEPVVVEIPE